MGAASGFVAALDSSLRARLRDLVHGQTMLSGRTNENRGCIAELLFIVLCMEEKQGCRELANDGTRPRAIRRGAMLVRSPKSNVVTEMGPHSRKTSTTCIRYPQSTEQSLCYRQESTQTDLHKQTKALVCRWKFIYGKKVYECFR